MTSADQGTASSALDARYGRTPERRSRQRLVAWIAGIGVAAVFVAWVVWVAFDGTGASIQSRMLAANIIDDRSTTLTVEVSAPTGTPVSCALEIQNESHAIVGWKVVDLPASDSYTRTVTENVRTVDLGVTGLIYGCWLA